MNEAQWNTLTTQEQIALLATLDKPRVSVSFKRSSTKDAGEGFDIDVQEGAKQDEADRVMALAMRLREQALEALKGPTLVDQLSAGIKD